MNRIFNTMSAFAVTLVFAAGSAQATEWNASLWGKRRAFTEHVEKLAELVSEKTDGEFTINLSYGGLSGPRDNLDGIAIGAFEMAQFCASYHGDKNRTLTVLELPFLGVGNLKEQVAVAKAVYAHPATKAEMARWNATLLMPSPQPQYNLVGKGAPIRHLSDFDGLRIRATGNIGAAFAALGAIPTSVTAPETYNAMDSGVVDAVALAPHAHLAYGTIDIADWWTKNLYPGTGSCPVVVNTDAYEALSEPNRKALDESVGAALGHYIDNYQDILVRWDEILKEKDVEIIEFPNVVIEEFRSSAAPIHEKWIKNMEAQGIPGQELFDLVEETLIKYRTEQ